MKKYSFPLNLSKTLQVNFLKHYTVIFKHIGIYGRKLKFSHYNAKRAIQKTSFAFLTFLFFSLVSLFAQTRMVTGTVHDEKASPVAGVSVIVKGSPTEQKYFFLK